jgi:hypothetical protein
MALQSASVEFAEDARHRVCSCSLTSASSVEPLPQALDNAADPVKSALPACWVVAESDLSGRLVGSKPEAKTEAGGVA